jgi:hypothetical protein
VILVNRIRYIYCIYNEHQKVIMNICLIPDDLPEGPVVESHYYMNGDRITIRGSKT